MLLEYTVRAILLLVNFLALRYLIKRRRRKQAEPPLVRHPIPFVGGALDFGKDPLGYLTQLKEKHGDVYTIELAGWNTHVFMNPLDVRNLERARLLDHKDIIGDFVTNMVGPNHYIHNNPQQHQWGFVSRVVKQWKKWRHGAPSVTEAVYPTGKSISKRIEHALESNLRGTTQLTDLCQVARSAVVIALQRVLEDAGVRKGASTVDLYDACKRIIFDVTFNMLFGSLPDPQKRAEETARFYEVFKVYFKGSPLLVDRIPIHFLPETKRALSKMLEMISEINWSERRDVSQLITEIVNANPRKNFRDSSARHLMIILWSAQANTAPALFWSLTHLFANPDAKHAALQEYEEFLSKTKSRSSSFLTNESESAEAWPVMNDILSMKKKDIDKLVLIDGCLKETMRLTGSSMSMRKASADMIVNTHSGRNFAIRKGDYTMFFARVTHMDEEIFDNPTEYDHERFLLRENESSESSAFDGNSSSGHSSSGDSDARHHTRATVLGTLRSRSRFFKERKRIPSSRAIMTFGFGTTRCPGRHIALIEIKLVALALLKHFDVSLVEPMKKLPDFDLTHLGFGVMPPTYEVQVNICMRGDDNNNRLFPH